MDAELLNELYEKLEAARTACTEAMEKIADAERALKEDGK